MYGSASIRQPGTSPIYIQHLPAQFNKQPTSSPSPTLLHINPQSYYPLPELPFTNYGPQPIPLGYPFIIHDLSPEVGMISSSRSAALPRNAVQKPNGVFLGPPGRQDYLGIHPGFIRARYPTDLGFVRGHGFEKEHTNVGLGKPRLTNARVYASQKLMRNPDIEEPADGQHLEEPCGPCGGGEFLCISTCDCIPSVERLVSTLFCYNYLCMSLRFKLCNYFITYYIKNYSLNTWKLFLGEGYYQETTYNGLKI